MSSDLTLSPTDIITTCSYRFKIKVNFKVVKLVIGAFFCHFWTSTWTSIKNGNQRYLSSCNSLLEKKLTPETKSAIEGFILGASPQAYYKYYP
jgi:choline-glycine betaine transporter